MSTPLKRPKLINLAKLYGDRPITRFFAPHKAKRFFTKPVDAVDEYINCGGDRADIVSRTAQIVTDYSSQYGNDSVRISSYSAKNLAGNGNIYPKYGDYKDACVFRTYGPWWDIVPSSSKHFKRTPPSFCSEDYIELAFPKKVYPLKLEIYETYNPGCVVKILAFEQTGILNRWKTLWEGKPSFPGHTSRMFCPPLNKCPFPTDVIRLELCHRHADYFTELDYVVLVGTSKPHDSQPSIKSKGDDVTETAEQLGQLSLSSPTKPDRISTMGQSHKTHPNDGGYFTLLPEEVMQLVLSFLDVLSLCRVARTSRLLYQHSYDTKQYLELNLQPHWPQVNDVALESLQSRSKMLQRLNLSWCHKNIVSEDGFCSYIQACGNTLKDLYLFSCNFITHQSMQKITKYCPNLTELDVGSCKQIESDGFYDISNLKSLERLNLYRTNIDQNALLSIIRSCVELRHLNLGSVNTVNTLDEVLESLGEHSKHLKSVNLWRCVSVSSAGVVMLAAGCLELEELEIGWCKGVDLSDDCIIELVKKCRNMKKLFLTANRSVRDDDLLAISQNCKHLEQFDILGTQVSPEAVEKVLKSCSKLKLFDVSFCSGVKKDTVDYWLGQFPQVDIKQSFQ